jgi:hypothetical protein
MEKLFQTNQEEVLLLGAYPTGGDRWLGSSLGVLANHPDAYELGLCMGPEAPIGIERTLGLVDYAVLNFGHAHKYDISADQGFYTLRLGGEYYGDHYLNPVGVDEVTKLWREASNRVQKQFA